MLQGPMKKVDKVWGFEELWINEPEYCFKVLVIKPGYSSSKHYHIKKKETFLVLKGNCHLIVWEKGLELHYDLAVEKQVTILPGQPHKFFLDSTAPEPCLIYEISTHDDAADVVRQSDSGRI